MSSVASAIQPVRSRCMAAPHRVQSTCLPSFRTRTYQISMTESASNFDPNGIVHQKGVGISQMHQWPCELHSTDFGRPASSRSARNTAKPSMPSRTPPPSPHP